MEEGAIASLAFADKVLITASRESRVRLYDLENDAKELIGFYDDAPVDRACMQADQDFDNLITLSGEKTVHRWQARQVSGSPRIYEVLRIAHGAPVTAVSVQGRIIATASNDRHARMWAKSGFGSDSGFDHTNARSVPVQSGRPLRRHRRKQRPGGLGLRARIGSPPSRSDFFSDHATLLAGATRVVTWGYSATPQIRDVVSKTVIADLGEEGGTGSRRA